MLSPGDDVPHVENQPLRSHVRLRRSRQILLVTPQPFYDDRGTPIAVEHTARALGELGYRVDVLAFPFGRNVAIPRVKTIRSGNPMGLRSVPIGFSWQKCLLDASLLKSFERQLRKYHYDVVHAVEEAAYIASHVCPPIGMPYVYDMASSIPAELARKPFFGSRPAQLILNNVERRVLDRASHVLCSMGLAEHVTSSCDSTPVSEWRYPSIPTVVDQRQVDGLRSELQLCPTDRVIVYAGNFARYQGMDLLFAAFEQALAEDENLLLVCVGATENDRRHWAANTSPHMATRMRIVSRQPRSCIPTYLALADVLISLRPVSKNLPLKVFEYMASGVPIVATRGPAHEPLLSKERAYLRGATPESIADGILEAIRQPDKSVSIGQRARSYAATQLGWKRFTEFVDTVYESVFDYRSVANLAQA